MQKLQDSVFTLMKTTNLSPAVFSFLQPTDDSSDKTPLGGILKDTKHGWLALGPKFCVVDLRTGMKVAARTFGATLSNNATVTSVVELLTPLTENSQQLIVSLQCDDISIIVVLNINGSQILRCIQTDVVVTQLAISDKAPDGVFSCFDGVVIAGTKRGEIFGFDLNRTALIQALKYITQGYEHLIQNEMKPTNLNFLPRDAINHINEQRELAVDNDHHLAVLLNENSFIDAQYIFRNPDGSVRMKANRDHIRVTVLEYIPQTGSVAVGFNFGAFQLWNLMTLDLEFTSQVNVECLPVTHFGFQEPCDDPRAFCYLWVIFSVIDRYEEEEFPLAVMYSLTYQGKRMLSDTKCLYLDFSSATIRFQVELSTVNDLPLLGGKCISCHTYSIKSSLGDEGEDSMLNLCQLVWECWAENKNTPMQYGMLLFDLDQWYKDQMPSTYRVESNAFLSASSWSEVTGGSGSVALHARLDPASVTPYSHATRLEEHFYPNSLQYNCICLNTSEVCVLSTIGIQRQIISSMDEAGPTALLHPPRLYSACSACGLAPLYANTYPNSQEDQRRYLLSVALEARLARFLKRCAHDWATGSHSGVGCTLPFLVDWCWKRAIELKENAKELTVPLFMSSALPDRNIVRCLEHCVQQLTQLTGLMDAILTKCCNLVVPDALSEMEEKHKGIGTVSLYFQVVQWFLRVGLLPERVDGSEALPYPAGQLLGIYNKRRVKLNRIQDNATLEDNSCHKSCLLLYIDQLLEQEFGGERIHEMWLKGGSECAGLYPPPSLYALLRLYLLPDIAEEHKHSLVLYLLVDYSMIYDDVRYETVIRRLMQFPTMFGLSNTAIKATQAFWHLDHRDFDFALDQLQCLTGNTLSDWQHNVVLSSLLAQKKTQAALQYLHVRKPAPIQNIKDGDYSKLNDHDKLDDWQSCCNLYLARGLVYEALDVIRMCEQNAGSLNDKVHVLNMFFKGCRNTGNLSKALSVSFTPFEEEVFIKYLENCNESQTSNILIMYYLQHARYLEAERYNTKLRHVKPKARDMNNSAESLFDCDREEARDNLVEAMCAALPSIAETVAHCALDQREFDWRVHAPKPMSVFVKAKSPKNTFTYKSSFIQDTIQNASETWMYKPQIRKGLKRMLNIEETPFICTPKLSRSRSIFTDMQSESTPPKRARLNLTGTPKTPRSAFKVSDKLDSQMCKLLDMPEVHSPVGLYDRPETPHSILKSRTYSRIGEASPTCSRYLEDTDDEMETASNHTHYSDSTNKHLRFTIPTPTELNTEPTPSPIQERKIPSFELTKERERSASTEREKEQDASTAESYVTTASHAMNESNPLESPPKKLATEVNVAFKKAYKDSVRARRSLSISANSSLSDDPNTSIESIADIPITLINPRYSGQRRPSTESKEQTEMQDTTLRYVGVRESVDRWEKKGMDREVPITPKGRRGIRAGSESTPKRSSSITPERQDSPAITPLRSGRISRSRSRTPELSPRSSPLAVIIEQPKQETESEPHAERSTLSVPRNLRSRSRTPERLDKGARESPKLEAIKESPTKSGSDSPPQSPSRRNLRSRSRTPEVETIDEPVIKPSLRSLRSRSKTPEKMSPSKEHSVKTKKSLSRLVLEANTFAKTKQTEVMESETTETTEIVAIECTPMKSLKPATSLMDFTLSPIANKSLLHSSSDSVFSGEKQSDTSNKDANQKSLFALHATYFEKSVLRSYESSVADVSESVVKDDTEEYCVDLPMPNVTAILEDFNKSVLHSFESSLEKSQNVQDMQDMESAKPAENVTKSLLHLSFETPITPGVRSVLHSYDSSLADTTHPQNMSSLITDDSDIEMTGVENKEKQKEIANRAEQDKDNKEREEQKEKEYKERAEQKEKEKKEIANIAEQDDYNREREKQDEIENKERAEQKEKEKIVEIEREIHEIEDDMSDERNVGSSVKSDMSSEQSRSENEESDDGDDEIIEIQISSDETDNDEEEEDDDDDDQEEDDDSSQSRPIESSDDSSSVPAIKNTESKSMETQSEPGKSEKSDSSVLNKIACPKIDLNIGENPKPIQINAIDPLNQAQISLMTEDGSIAIDDDDIEPEKEGTNPLDQALMSIMTDDNSTIVEDEQSTQDLAKSINDKLLTDKELAETKDLKKVEIVAEDKSEKLDMKTSDQIEPKIQTDKPSEKATEVSLMTEDGSGSQEDFSLNYSGDTLEDERTKSPGILMQCDIVQNIPKLNEVTTELVIKEPLQNKDVIENSAYKTELKVNTELTVDKKTKKMDIESQSEITKPEVVVETKTTAKPAFDETSKAETVADTSKLVTVQKTLKPYIESAEIVTAKNTDCENMDTESQHVLTTTQKISDSVQNTDRPELVKVVATTQTMIEEKKDEIVQKMETDSLSQTSEQEIAKTIGTRKRIKSLSTDIEPKDDEPKTPTARRRAQSRAKSIDMEVPKVDKSTSSNTSEEKTPARKQSQSRAKSIEVEISKIDKSTSSNTSGEITPARKRGQSRAKSIEVEIPKVEKSTSSNTSEEKTPARKRPQSRVKSIEVEYPKIDKLISSNISEDEPKSLDNRMIDKSTSSNTSEEKTPTRKRAQSRAKSIEVDITAAQTEESKIPATRKRTSKPTKTDDTVEDKTPITTKISQETTPDNLTPSRVKTPTSEARKIITRRMSREMKLDESNRSIDDSISTTPKRQSRKNDDTESIASGSSISSVQSESKRRGRKSTVATKPDLSVIPEVLAEESREHSTLDVMNYSDARRMTRNQQKMLETSRGRRPSTASRASRSSLSEIEEEEGRSAFDLQPIDRISLLNKEAYDGPPDEDELQLSSMSPESIASDASRMRSRMARAASETKVVKAAKIHRRIASVDVAEESPVGSPVLSGTDSPARGRRASFNRAIEALHTPKGRRQSTDSRKSELGSPVDSPVSEADAPTTPSRRRRASTHSNTSLTGRTRSKKMPVLEEIKETNK